MALHCFDTKVATEFGLPEAILINHFQFWIAFNRAQRQNNRKGRTWTYHSVKALQELFPYMGVKQIRGALKRLEDQGVLLVDNFNQTPYDRTLWYAFADEDRWLDLPQSRIGKKTAEICPKGEPIPDKSPDKLPDEKGEISPPPLHEETVCTPVVRASEHEGVDWPWETETFWEAWATWREFKRKQHKFVFKLKASEQAALNHLRELSGDSEAIAHAIMRQSLAHGWKGFHELKNDTNGTHQAGRNVTGTPLGQKPGTSQARTDAIAAWGSRPAGGGAEN